MRSDGTAEVPRAVTRVWLPEPPEAFGGLPDGMTADVWTGGEPPVLGAGQLHEALSRADVAVLLVPVTAETRGMADAGFLAAMKDGALLVNAARGSIVDTGALLRELNSGRLRAALDVTDPEPLPAGHPLWRAPGLLLTPHIGGHVTSDLARANQVVRAQLGRYAAGEPLRNVIGDQGY